MGKEKKEPDMERELAQEYERWEHLWKNGGSDPFHDDAVNLNLVRNHIIYWKKKIEESCGADQNLYPAIYFRELPPEIGKGYMVKAAEIRNRAAEILDSYLEDDNFQYLLYHQKEFKEKEVKVIGISKVLGYVKGLAAALKEDDLVAMRRHVSKPETYRESFATCAEKVKQIREEKKRKLTEKTEYAQMTLAEFGIGMGQVR